MNELREKIIQELRGGQKPAINSELYDTKILELLFGQKTDAILDAVIAALPEGKQIDYAMKNDITNGENKDRFFRYGGYDFALSEVASILQAAKENK